MSLKQASSNVISNFYELLCCRESVQEKQMKQIKEDDFSSLYFLLGSLLLSMNLGGFRFRSDLCRL